MKLIMKAWMKKMETELLIFFNFFLLVTDTGLFEITSFASIVAFKVKTKPGSGSPWVLNLILENSRGGNCQVSRDSRKMVETWMFQWHIVPVLSGVLISEHNY